MHIPTFPPTVTDWIPGNLIKLEPPLPHFLVNPYNPWLPADIRKEIEKTTGYWSVHRAESMVPETMGPDAVRTVATRLWSGIKSRWGL